MQAQIRFEHPEIATVHELVWDFLFLPIVIFSGFGRVIYTSERKYQIMQISISQELFFHCMPLGLVIHYNIASLGKNNMSLLDKFVVAIMIINAVMLVVEALVFQMCKNRGVNLDKRPPLKSSTREHDLQRVAIVSMLFSTTMVLLGSYGFVDQGCVKGYFQENSICKDC